MIKDCEKSSQILRSSSVGWKNWPERNLMKFSWGEMQVLHLAWFETRLSKSGVELTGWKAVWQTVQPCSKEGQLHTGSCSHEWSHHGKGRSSLFGTWEAAQECCVQLWDPSVKTDIETLEWAHLRAPKAGRGLRRNGENCICLAFRGERISRDILLLTTINW